ncbi:MAG TPA: hypothetical protein VN493_06815 [Thermoanaerobaculia bacterium]|nr:hypothetical protein [Thermoanaerobaculia bacterium]
MLANLSTGETELFTCSDLPQAHEQGVPAVSGTCFSEDDQLLAVSTRSSRMRYSPTFLFEVSGLRVVYRDTFVQSYEDNFGGPCPTGVLLYGEYLITRNNVTELADVIAVWRLPESQSIGWDKAAQHLTHSQVAVVRETVVTGGGGSLKLGGWRSDIGKYEEGKAADGLVFAPLGTDGRASAAPVDGCRRITAIVATPTGDGFITGGLDGELDLWSWAAGWNQERLQGPTEEKTIDSPGLAWATYTPNSIVGICYLSDSNRWVSVDASGELGIWAGRVRQGSWQIPVSGSPRALAAHPIDNRIAIGVKQGGTSHPGSVVVIADLGLQ